MDVTGVGILCRDFDGNGNAVAVLIQNRVPFFIRFEPANDIIIGKELPVSQRIFISFGRSSELTVDDKVTHAVSPAARRLHAIPGI